MKKLLLTATCCLMAAAMVGTLAACGGNNNKGPEEEQKHVHAYNENGVCECGAYEVPFITDLPMDPTLQMECDQQGTVVDFKYRARSYALEAADDSDAEIWVDKTAQVYLPYGYDESKQYNILYLMHGGGETYSYWLTKMGTVTRNVLDNMIKNDVCDPTIIVCPTYESPVTTSEPEEGEEEGEVAALAEETEGTPSAAYADWTSYFWMEFRNDLVPAVETEYSTYAESTDLEGLIASREHRGFAGFSMGSITTIQVMMHCTDIASYYGSYSAGYSASIEDDGWGIVKEAITSDELKDYDVGYWFNQNGTVDQALPPHEKLMEAALADPDGLFINGKNYAWICIPGGSHAYNCWIIGLYDSLLVFFQ